MSKLEVNAIDSVGSTLTLGDTNATTLALNSSITTLPSALANTPSFFAYRSSNQSISNASVTTVVHNAEIYDTDSAYDTSNGRFTVPSGKAGKYMFTLNLMFTTNDTDSVHLGFQKNGGSPFSGYDGLLELNGGTNIIKGGSMSIIFDLSVGDYITSVVYQDAGGTRDAYQYRTNFCGHRIIGA